MDEIRVDPSGQEQSKAAIAARTADQGFVARYLSGDVEAVSEMRRLHETAYGDANTAARTDLGSATSMQATLTPDEARVRIAARMADKNFAEKYLGNDADALAEMKHLHEVAFPSEQRPPEGSETIPASDTGPSDLIAFQGASSPMDYDFGAPPLGAEQSLEQETYFRSLFVEHEIPASIGSQIGKLWNAAVANPPSDVQLEKSYEECNEALQRMWGDDAEKNLAVANREVARMAKSHPEIIQMLEVSGLGNSPWLASTLYRLARVRGRA